MNIKIESIMEIIEEFDAKGDQNESFELLRRRISYIISQNETLVLLTFTCSTINADQMFSSDPWNYVCLNPEGNNLTADIERMSLIVARIELIYPNTKLRIVIGNTDPYYIYTQQFSVLNLKKDLLWKEFSKRWETYKQKFDVWIKPQVKNIQYEVVSWYEFEKDIERTYGDNFEQEYERTLRLIDRYSKSSDLTWEFERLSCQFEVSGYFEGLSKPEDSILKDWVRRKFAEYAVQALWIRTYMPNALLIQNEKPSDLRTSMYQPLVRERCNEDFPVFYFCSVDNDGYR